MNPVQPETPKARKAKTLEAQPKPAPKPERGVRGSNLIRHRAEPKQHTRTMQPQMEAPKVQAAHTKRVTVTAHIDNWPAILAGILQTLQILGPVIIRLVSVNDKTLEPKIEISE